MSPYLRAALAAVLLLLVSTRATIALEFAIGAEVMRATNQSISNAADNLVTWPTVNRDDANFYNAGASTKLTAPEAGWYAISASIRYASNTTGQRYLWFKINGAFTGAGIGTLVATGGGDSGLNGSLVRYMNKGDYVEIDVFQNSGGALNVTAGLFDMVRLPGATGNAYTP